MLANRVNYKRVLKRYNYNTCITIKDNTQQYYSVLPRQLLIKVFRASVFKSLPPFSLVMFPVKWKHNRCYLLRCNTKFDGKQITAKNSNVSKETCIDFMRIYCKQTMPAVCCKLMIKKLITVILHPILSHK